MSVFDGLKSLKRLKELEETMLRLTRLVESRDLDWQDMRARVKRLLDRTEKAARALEPVVESDEVEQPAVPSGGEEAKTILSLSPAQRRLQEQIQRLRRTG